MSNITLETSNFSEQLGIYDFFNVIISGAVFIFSLCAINFNLYALILEDITTIKGLGMVLFIYIIGLILQEIASLLEKKTFDFYKKMNRSILKDTFDENGKKKASNDIIDNPLLIEQYRKYADDIVCNLSGTNKMSDLTRYNNEDVNGFFFSVCQYYVAVNGKDKKVEKMRALYSMSKTLMVCFGILAIITIFIFQKNSILGNALADVRESMLENMAWSTLRDILEYICSKSKIIIAGAFGMIAYIFYHRTQKTMRYFLLILLGTYDAIIRSEKDSKTSVKSKMYLTQKEYEKIKMLVDSALSATNKKEAETYIRRIESYGYNLSGKTSYILNELVRCARDASSRVPDKEKRKYPVRRKLYELEKYGVRWHS